jgi:hypothetical protein
VVQAVDRALGFLQGAGDLDRAEAHDVPQDQHFALVVRQLFEGFANVEAPFESGFSLVAVGDPDLLGRDRAPRPQMIERRVARDPHDPGRERDSAFLVLGDRRHQLGEHVVGDVFRLVVVAHEAVDVAQDVIGEAHVEEVDPLGVTFLGPANRLSNETAFLGTNYADRRRAHGFSCMLTACGYC